MGCCSGAGLRCACGAIAAAVPFFWSFFWACKKTDNEYLVESLVYYLSHFCLEIKGEAKIIRIPAVVFLALMRALPFKKIQCPCGLNFRNFRNTVTISLSILNTQIKTAYTQLHLRTVPHTVSACKQNIR